MNQYVSSTIPFIENFYENLGYIGPYAEPFLL